MSKSHFSITSSMLLALIGNLATAVVAIVPAWASEKQIIVGALGGIISNLFPLINGIHRVAASNVSVKDVEAGAIAAAQQEAIKMAGKIDFTSLVKAAVDAKSLPDLEALVRAEVQRLVSSMFTPPAQPAAAPPSTS